MDTLKLQRPTSVKIGPYHYEIQWVPVAAMEDLGKADKTYLWIKVREDLPLEQQRVTLLHEIVHAVSGVTDMDAGRNMEEEEWAQIISGTLYDVLANNDDVRRWMFGKP